MNLRVHEIFASIQSEGPFTGKPSVFVRLSTCQLQVSECKTESDAWKGRLMTFDEILSQIGRHGTPYVCVIGEKPLTQQGTIPLLKILVDKGYIVSLEADGTALLAGVPPAVIKSIEVRCAESRQGDGLAWEDVDLVRAEDHIKFVVASRADFDWSYRMVRRYNLTKRCTLLFSPAPGKVRPAELAGWLGEVENLVTVPITEVEPASQKAPI